MCLSEEASKHQADSFKLAELPCIVGFPCGLAGKESACKAGDLGLIPGLGRSPREGKGYPVQYSGLENSMDCMVRGGAESRTSLSLSPCIVDN